MTLVYFSLDLTFFFMKENGLAVLNGFLFKQKKVTYIQLLVV
jgi:hypothetical protein